MRLALVLWVSIATALCPLRTCFERNGTTESTVPGGHSHEDHQGPDRDAGCCVDVPRETGGPWVVVQLDLPEVRWAEPEPAPEAPSDLATADAPRDADSRPTVLLR